MVTHWSIFNHPINLYGLSTCFAGVHNYPPEKMKNRLQYATWPPDVSSRQNGYKTNMTTCCNQQGCTLAVVRSLVMTSNRPAKRAWSPKLWLQNDAHCERREKCWESKASWKEHNTILNSYIRFCFYKLNFSCKIQAKIMVMITCTGWLWSALQPNLADSSIQLVRHVKH